MTGIVHISEKKGNNVRSLSYFRKKGKKVRLDSYGCIHFPPSLQKSGKRVDVDYGRSLSRKPCSYAMSFYRSQNGRNFIFFKQKSSLKLFFITHLILEVSLHSCLIWPTVRRAANQASSFLLNHAVKNINLGIQY